MHSFDNGCKAGVALFAQRLVKPFSGNAGVADLSRLDFNLLLDLDALLREGSVVGAARVLHLSAPAMSRRLTRLAARTGSRDVRCAQPMTCEAYSAMMALYGKPIMAVATGSTPLCTYQQQKSVLL